MDEATKEVFQVFINAFLFVLIIVLIVLINPFRIFTHMSDEMIYKCDKYIFRNNMDNVKNRIVDCGDIEVNYKTHFICIKKHWVDGVNINTNCTVEPHAKNVIGR